MIVSVSNSTVNINTKESPFEVVDRPLVCTSGNDPMY